DFVPRAFVAKAEQQDTMVRLAAAKDELAKIFVISKKDARLVHSSGKDFGVAGLGHCLGNGEHIVGAVAQVFDHSYSG
nr:hypothetical protein [Dehalococcoidales bacterium]